MLIIYLLLFQVGKTKTPKHHKGLNDARRAETPCRVANIPNLFLVFFSPVGIHIKKKKKLNSALVF